MIPKQVTKFIYYIHNINILMSYDIISEWKKYHLWLGKIHYFRKVVILLESLVNTPRFPHRFIRPDYTNLLLLKESEEARVRQVLPFSVDKY